MSHSMFGVNFKSIDLQKAVEKTIREFLQDYLAEAERQEGLKPKTLKEFKSYEHVNEFRNWADDEVPVCVIVSPQVPEFKHKGNGEYWGVFDLGVACIVHANNRENTNKLARIYGPVVRQLLLQQAGLGGVAHSLELEAEKFDDVPESEDRAEAVAQIIFTVEVPNVVNGRKGIIVPSDDPYGIDGENPLAVKVGVTTNDEEQEVGP